MKNIFKKIDFYLGFTGISISTFIAFIRGIPFYFKDYLKLRKEVSKQDQFIFGKYWPILNQRNTESGELTFHYFYQDLFFAQRIFSNKPMRHIDIGSRIDGFVAHVAAFREIEIFDIRPLDKKIPNVTFSKADLMQLPENLIDCCDSISSLHAIEHFGLGRYGDPIDLNGPEKAINNIYKIVRKGGKFYFGTPIGQLQRIEFNAHRVFSIKYLIELFDGKFKLEHFSYIDDNNELHRNIDLTSDAFLESFNLKMGCGLFELTKI
jgi:SAM-dependent methyltransferase